MGNFIEEMKWRGMVHDMMPGTEEQLAKENEMKKMEQQTQQMEEESETEEEER